MQLLPPDYVYRPSAWRWVLMRWHSWRANCARPVDGTNNWKPGNNKRYWHHVLRFHAARAGYRQKKL
jgi:hypothetical protein